MTTAAPATLILGASGYIGTHLTAKLSKDGVPVRAAARHLDALSARSLENVELCHTNADDPDSLKRALCGVSTVYYLIHAMNHGRGFSRREQQWAKHFSHAARQAGVQHVIYLGALAPATGQSEHLQARRLTGDILRQAGLTVTEIRAGIIVGPGSAAYEVIRDLVSALPVMVTPKWVHTHSPPIALSNLLTYLAKLPDHPTLHGQILDAGGPESLSYQDLMRQYGALVGRQPRIIPVPVLTPKLSSYWLRLVTAVPTNLARALIDGLSHSLSADDAPLRSAMPQQLLTYREAVQQALDDEQKTELLTRWTEGAIQFRNYRNDTSFYAKRCVVELEGNIDRETLWQRITRIGGDNGFPAWNGLFVLRGWIDWAIGGPGRTKGRSRLQPRLGDTIDSWRVVALEPGQSLSLMMGMKAPGAGILEFTCVEQGDGSRLRIAAYWHPSGIAGFLYWYALLPIHQPLFQRMGRRLLAP